LRKVLISFIGTGKKAEGSEAEQYQKTIYQLPNGLRRKSSLITSVLFNHLDPDKTVIIGTSQSIWAELSQITPDKLENQKIYEEIWEETWSGQVSENTLHKWEKFLKETLKKDFSLNLISTEAKEEIIEILYRELPENSEKVFLDITHAFRHFPLIAAFTLPVIKYIKNFKNLTLVYGKLTKNRPSPVYFLDVPGKLMELLEAVSLVEYSGNFEKFSEVYDDELFSRIYLKAETNRPISKKDIAGLKRKIKDNKNIYQHMASEVVDKKVIPYLQGERLELRMANRALFFAERKQFLKAYTLIHEALVTAIMKKFNLGNPDRIDDRQKANVGSQLSGEDRKTFEIIRNLRNAITHGSQPKGRHSSEILNALNNVEILKSWVLKGKELIEKL